MTSKQYHHGDLKASLITAANVILSRDGADALSLRAIAAEAGVSHMAPYAHFKNKKELIKSIAEAGFVEMAETMEAVAADLKATKRVTSADLVLAYGASYLEFATRNPELYRLMLGQVETTGRKSKKESIAAPQTQSESTLQVSVTPLFSENTQRPFVLLKEAFALNGDQAEAKALGAWSMVHGMAALMIEGHIQRPKGISFKRFLVATIPFSKQLK